MWEMRAGTHIDTYRSAHTYIKIDIQYTLTDFTHTNTHV